ncbi:MAG: ABC transporter permease [Bdellovibrionaceae bacterium]|nr:ABC transporter permease [Pseudobdellovibrionaceae bacterium]
MFHLWLTFRFVTSGRRLLSLASVLSLVGMTIGVACLTVAMSVVAGFEDTLTRSVQDVYGHILVLRRQSRGVESVESFYEQVKKIVPEAVAYTPVLDVKALIAHNQKITYVSVQGVENETVQTVLNIVPRVVRGSFDLKAQAGIPAALIGKGIARKFELKPGDRFKVVVPKPLREDSTGFAPSVREFVVTGVLDLGKNDYDEHVVVTDLAAAQDIAQVKGGISGLRLKLTDPQLAKGAAIALESRLGPGYFAASWYDVNENLFEAIRYERPVLFVVLLVMIIAASFNISSNLFVSVLRKYSDISILRAMGFGRRDVMKVFTMHGVILGAIGTFAGIILGLVLSGIFVWAQSHWVLMPGDVYKLDHVGVVFRWQDLAAVVAASLLVSFVSTWMPAFRGSRLDPVEGLRYE